MLSGAGVFIIQNYKGRNVVVLFGNNTEYSDPGGTIDFGETSIEAACREAREESGNLLKLEPKILRNIAIPIQHRNYMSYFIYIKNLSLKDYYHNMNLIYSKCDPYKHHHWMETNRATRINLDELIKNSVMNNNLIRDIDGRVIRVRRRVLEVMREALRRNIFLQLIYPYELNPKLTFYSRMPCLIGTHTYTL